MASGLWNHLGQNAWCECIIVWDLFGFVRLACFETAWRQAETAGVLSWRGKFTAVSQILISFQNSRGLHTVISNGYHKALGLLVLKTFQLWCVHKNSSLPNIWSDLWAYGLVCALASIKTPVYIIYTFVTSTIGANTFILKRTEFSWQIWTVLCTFWKQLCWRFFWWREVGVLFLFVFMNLHCVCGTRLRLLIIEHSLS